MKSAKIVGLGKYLPPKILTNEDLEKIVDTSDQWITERTGIKNRHIVEKGVPVSQLGFYAAEQALQRAGIKAKDLDLIIFATITPDMPFPSASCILQDKLGAKNAACFDLSAACSGFVYGLTTAWNFLRTGMYKNVLVIGAEVLSAFTDWHDRSTCVLFADGGGAAVLVPTDNEREGVLSSYLGANGSDAHLLNLPAGGSACPASAETVARGDHYIKMKGNELFRIAVRAMVKAAKESLKGAGLESDDVDLLIPHQANIRIIDAVTKRLGLTGDRVFINIEKYGNMSAACSIVALCEAWEQDRIKKGDIVVIDTFGGGLVWGANVIKWA